VFLAWTGRHHLTEGLAVPSRRRSEPSLFLSDDQRWQQLRRCLHDPGMPADARIAGALVLLFGASVTRITWLTAADITPAPGGTSLRLGGSPLLLPPRLATLMTQQAASAAARPAAQAVPAVLLFPGRVPGRPVHPRVPGRKIARHGISARAARNTAMITLAADLPSPVVAGLLGLHPSTASRWMTFARRDWAAYLQARDASGSIARAGSDDGAAARSAARPASGRDAGRSAPWSRLRGNRPRGARGARDAVSDLDLSFIPPPRSPRDAVQMAPGPGSGRQPAVANGGRRTRFREQAGDTPRRMPIGAALAWMMIIAT
jgi:hypothetical protein